MKTLLSSLHETFPRRCTKPSLVVTRNLPSSLHGTFSRRYTEPSLVVTRNLPSSLHGTFSRHCEERSDEAIHSLYMDCRGRLRLPRNDTVPVIARNAVTKQSILYIWIAAVVYGSLAMTPFPSLRGTK